MKRLIVCSDGTWQKLESPYPTNVVKIAQAIKPSCSQGISQVVFYDEGVGSGNTAEKLFAKADQILGGACGIGIDNNIQDAYRFLSLNYEPGDEIYLFGFSRGAYTVRSLAGLIHSSGGLLSLPHIREMPSVYDLYRDRTLTHNEKAEFRKLPFPYTYDPNVDVIKKCRAEALKIYRDRSVFKTVEDANDAEEKGREEAKFDLQRKQEKVRYLLRKYNLSEREEKTIRQDAKITLLACWDTVGSLGIPSPIPQIGEWINRKYKFHDAQLSSRVQNALHAVAIDELRKIFDVTLMERNLDDNQLLDQVWFPGAHGGVGGGSQAERGLSDRTLQWMMDKIAELGLGLKFDPNVVENGIQPNYKSSFNNRPGFYGLVGVIHRDLGNTPSVDHSAEERWNDDSNYRPSNLAKYAEKNGWKPPISTQDDNLMLKALNRILDRLSKNYFGVFR